MSTILTRLAQSIKARKGTEEEKSYVARLLKSGPQKCAEKFGEEAIEAIIAAITNDRKNLTEEAADVLFHLLVMLESRDISLEEVMAELERREGISGLAEKKARKTKP